MVARYKYKKDNDVIMICVSEITDAFIDDDKYIHLLNNANDLDIASVEPVTETKWESISEHMYNYNKYDFVKSISSEIIFEDDSDDEDEDEDEEEELKVKIIRGV